MTEIINAITNFLKTTGIYQLFAENDNWWQYLVMYVIVGALFYLAIVKKFEPLLLMPIAFGMLLANLPAANLIHLEYFFDDYYIGLVDFNIEEMSAELKPYFDEFLNALRTQFGENAYVIEDGIVKFNESLTFEQINPIFDKYIADFAFLSKDLNLSVINPDSQYAFEFKEFLNALDYYAQPGSYGTGSLWDSSIYTIKDNMIEFADFLTEKNPSKFQEIQQSAFESLFRQSCGDFATFDGTIHIKMTTIIKEVVNNGGLLDVLYLGVKLGVYPSLIFMGVGAMTDFTPLIANPKSLLMGAGAQLGVFAAFFFALFMGFTPMQAGSIGIIGGADGPTAILVTKILAPELLGAIAIAAYSYMALIPIIQPPFMRLFTTEKERKIKMGNLRTVTKLEKVIFPIIVTAIVCLIIPDAAPLVGFLMLGNLFNVSGVADRLSKTAQNELINIVTIFLGVSVGATANAENFLKPQTIFIIVLGLCAFCISTCGGLITGKIMCKLTGGKINPLIGSAGVSAVPMAARVAQDEGRKADPSNFLLMHAMGPNVAGVIGSAVAAGVFLSFLA